MGQKLQTLVLLSPGFARDEMDTTCIPVLQLFVKNLKIQFPRLQVFVLAFQYPFSAGEYAFRGARVISFNGRNRGKALRLVTWIKVWLTLARLHRQYRLVGLLSFWLSECAFVGSIFARRHRLKHFTWLLGQDAKAGNRYFTLIKPGSENLIVLSDALAAEVFKNYAVKPRHIIPLGIDPAIFPVVSGERNIDILGAGSLIPLKRYDLFVAVIQKLIVRFPGLRVVLCGKGPEKNRLLNQIGESNLQEVVTLVDEVPHAQVLALMQQSKIFLHTSVYEGFAAVCAEALYAGAQVVSFCRPIHQPIKNWHIVETEAELTDQLALLLANPDLCQDRVLPFTIQEACTRIMALFGHEGNNHGT
jgi:glycosyltransferase involved in cell wall biosynthesis